MSLSSFSLSSPSCHSQNCPMVKSSYSTLPIYSILEMAALPYKPTFELNFIDEIASQSAPAHQYYLL